MKKSVRMFLLALLVLSLSIFFIPEVNASELRIMGDVDNNGQLNYADALLTLRASIDLETLDPESWECADVDNNGKVNYSDAMLILRRSIDLEDSFPADFWTMTFVPNAEGVTGLPVPIDGTRGDAAQEPEVPSLKYYTFGGWYLEPECINAFDWSAPVTDNVTLYALWTPNKVVDLTPKLDALMHESADTLRQVLATQGHYDACIFYYHKVKDGGDWDIKLQDEWKFEEGTVYMYQGKVMRMDDPGNIHFGYLGAIILPEEIVCLGAGLNNISKFGFTAGDFRSYYDDPQDQDMMRWGYQLYRNGY